MASDSSVPISHVRISPSALSADFSKLGEECEQIEKAGADRIHWDVMDGQFVPNLSMSADIIKSCRPWVTLPFEAHLMVREPDHLLKGFAEAGCDSILVHAEACVHLHRTLSAIRDLGSRAGVVLNPHTPIDVLTHVLDLIDTVLLMSVNPGFGGQSHIRSVVPKISDTRRLLDGADHPIDIEVDGGINASTIAASAAAGANIFVSGSGVFNHPDGYASAITELREIGNHARG